MSKHRLKHLVGGGLVATTVIIGSATAASAAPNIGTLTFTPSSGPASTNFTMTSSAPCPAGTVKTRAVINNGGQFVNTVLTSTSSVGASTTDPMVIGVSNNLENIANQVGFDLASGDYTISLICQNGLGTTLFGQFDGHLTITAGTGTTQAERNNTASYVAVTAPPADLPESPYTALLAVVGAGVIGGGALVLRSRRKATAAV